MRRAFLIQRGAMEKEIKTWVSNDEKLSICPNLVTNNPGFAFKVIFICFVFLIESRTLLPAAGEDKMKPPTPSSSPPHCAPPSLELQPGSGAPVMENSQMNSSHSVKASNVAGDGMFPPPNLEFIA